MLATRKFHEDLLSHMRMAYATAGKTAVNTTAAVRYE